MNDTPLRPALPTTFPRASHRVWPPLAGLAIAVMVLLATLSGASAHAELIRADPPINGLVIAPPTQLTLSFSEEVEMVDPAPVIRVLSSDGRQLPATVRLGANPRQLVVDVQGIDNGTWTVAWTVTSATDGHALSGSYAFRVGGGIPAGQATVEGERPAAWGVATRWITFLGAAIAAVAFLAGFLFGPAADTPAMVHRRLVFGAIAAAVALLATVLEPVFQWISPPAGARATIGQTIRGMPDAWWIRPAALIVLLVLCGVALTVLKRRIAPPVAMLGGALGLGALLGLSLTSHAAGRETWSAVATASDVLHQWSTALWVGGLVWLGVLWLARPSTEPKGDDAPSVPLAIVRFSSIAFVLFLVALVTGVVNAGFVFPTTETTLPFGLGTRNLPAIDRLWSSDYGWVLLVKLVVLIVPTALAVYHRQTIRRALARGVALAKGAFRLSLRVEAIVAALVVLGGSVLAMSAPPAPDAEHTLDTVALASFAVPDQSEATDTQAPREIVHLTIDPADKGENAFTVRLTGADGAASDVTDTRVTITPESLSHSTKGTAISLDATSAPATFATESMDLSLDGWWRLTVHVSRASQQGTSAAFYLVLPDPNVHGFDAPPVPDNDPAAQQIFDRGMTTTTALTSMRRQETINSGLDAFVIADYAWVVGQNGAPNAFTALTAFSGSFVNRPDGSPPAPPTENSYRTVTVGDQSWRQIDDQWVDIPVIQYQPPAEWGETFEGARDFQMGATETLDGEECQIVFFHTPESASQAEAWFGWWVGKDTGLVRRLVMVANVHYMTWDNSDFNQPISITPPVNAGGTPAASPAASPEASPAA
ncbi:MAG: copper resistance protein CopC [Thermomicrobiales bacterium]